MYFIENKLDDIEIFRATKKHLLDDETMETSYFFDCKIKNPLVSLKSDCLFTIKNNSNKAVLRFSLELSKKGIKNISQSRNEILKQLEDNTVLKYFFKNLNEVEVDYVYLHNRNSMIVIFNGMLNFNVHSEYCVLFLQEFDKNLKELHNLGTIQFISDNFELIKKDCHRIWAKHEILNQLSNTFDVNSEDFLYSLKLHYEH